MKNKKLLVLVLFLAVFSLKASAQDICSKSGYTVLTINGIFTDEKGALLNKAKLKQNLPPSHKNEPIIVDYVYNATHFAGVLDLVDAVRQGLFDSDLDYDLVEMLDSASDKVTTQKILLVGHSQGNFYANNFYNKVADIKGGVPRESIGLYAVATPDDHVAGGGKYLTSDTDGVISAIVGRLKKIMTPNTHIELQKVDGNGHDFSNVYLKYRSAQIVSDIKSSFDNLETNSIQSENIACISPQKISILHDFTGVLLAATDFVVSTGVKVATLHFNITNKATNSFVNTLVKIAKGGLAAAGLADNKESTPIIIASAPAIVAEADEPIIATIDRPEEIIIDNIKINDPVIIDTVEDILVPDSIIIESSHSHNSSENNDVIKLEVIVPDVTIPEIIIPEIIVPKTATSEIIIPEIIVTEIATSEVIEEDKDDETTNDTTPPVVTLIGENPLYFARYTISTYRYTDYVESGATAIDDVDKEVDVVITGNFNYENNEIQTLTYTATDKAGNSSFKTRDIKISDRVYIPKYTFGTENGDGKDWQAWFFDGATIYNWSDTYVNKYLHEEFKIETQDNNYACNNCLSRGIFKSDPQKGFGVWTFTTSALENNPQRNNSGNTYDVSIQWDSTGYRTIISHDGTPDLNTYVSVPNMNNDLWVGWNGSSNNFKSFPAGTWSGINNLSKTGLEGGNNMMLTPFPVYDENAENTIPPIADEYVIPAIIDFNVNGSKNNITLNPAVDNPTITLVASKEVNWLTITIQKIEDEGVYKTLQSNSDTCVDGASTCAKIWIGDLSKGGLLQNGDYKIRVRIKDVKDSKDFTEIEYEEYLPIILTVEGGV